MRFFENGPRLPDELLTARDEERVVFFCGAGVSIARAGLPDFFGLAETVIRELGASPDSPVHKLLEEAKGMGQHVGVEGLISADRIFGLLEREFLTRDIETEVAKALQPLQPLPHVDLSAHKILLDLATTPKGKVQLVTTNFDRLFDACRDELEIWKAPRLPDPARHDELNGIVYLHGRVNDDYSGSEESGFVLSSAQFGRAYLAEGWATEFFKKIMARHMVVFVGYGADDPPVHYLLEGLNRGEGQASEIYAFQPGRPDEAAAKWRDKGVEAIAYSEEGDSHDALWETLAAWAERAKSPDDWYRSIIDLAKAGPVSLMPHQRGQVAYVVSTPAGAEKFFKSDPPPPAEWLCVFDRARRYARPPSRNPRYTVSDNPPADPFELYGLDSDTVPAPIDPNTPYEQREIPPDAWDAFAANPWDRHNLDDENFPVFQGNDSMRLPELSQRLVKIYIWLAKIADQPTAIWWAAHQSGLHPDIQNQIGSILRQFKKDTQPVIHQAWRYLFEVWERKPASNFDSDWYELVEVIERDGWDGYAVRKYAALHRPYFVVLPGPEPPKKKEVPSIGDLIGLEVKYPEPHFSLDIPDAWLLSVIRELRKNFEYALQLETEIGGSGLMHIVPIVPDDKPNIDDHQRTHGLSGSVLSFASLFEGLIKLDIASARREFAAWPVDDGTIFARLRIWAGGKAGLVPPETFGELMVGLSDDIFWDSSHQRDLLLALAERWNELPDKMRKGIEKRLLQGPTEWHEHGQLRAMISLERLQWLADNGCNFSFDLESEIGKLRQAAPDWKPEYAKGAVDSREIRSGNVEKDTEYSPLLDEPLATLLARAQELSGRTEENFLIEKDPFLGLSTERPVRALSALTHAARQGEYPAWAWRTFLHFKARENDKPRFSALIAERICRCPDNAISAFIHDASSWVSMNGSKHWAAKFPETFDRVISKFLGVFQSRPATSKTILTRGNKEPDWTMELSNAPAGKIAEALFFTAPKIETLKEGDALPEKWLGHVERLLLLDGDPGRYALVIFSFHLNWFYSFDPAWTEEHLLSAMEGEDTDDRNAFWSGFFWGGGRCHQALYLRIKSDLLAIAEEEALFKPGYRSVFTETVLWGWISRDEKTRNRLISHEEMCHVLLHAGDDFRVNMLWHLDKWSEDQETDSDETGNERRFDQLLEFLRNVWPRQKITRTPITSEQLCRIAFSNVPRFPEIAEIILPLLTEIPWIKQDYYSIRSFLKSEDEDSVIKHYPDQTRDILYAVLPDDKTRWPDSVEEILKRIDKAK
uniref:SIR2-like domain-containing protein n=1 Tax=Candidatus Kentrum sp. TUN TaxID=2126343 RepID=A0A450ZM46_9GAMM|nr:MAG: SIR2-like domain-containing protein [Candidatus Kentron sp. TUN]VFK60063.1 MAG: SIR2-like domain-containing protein [Candidatus Kentron sp. TUN]